MTVPGALLFVFFYRIRRHESEVFEGFHLTYKAELTGNNYTHFDFTGE